MPQILRGRRGKKRETLIAESATYTRQSHVNLPAKHSRQTTPLYNDSSPSLSRHLSLAISQSLSLCNGISGFWIDLFFLLRIQAREQSDPPIASLWSKSMELQNPRKTHSAPSQSEKPWGCSFLEGSEKLRSRPAEKPERIFPSQGCSKSRRPNRCCFDLRLCSQICQSKSPH